jgi:hypothetical protein
MPGPVECSDFSVEEMRNLSAQSMLLHPAPREDCPGLVSILGFPTQSTGSGWKITSIANLVMPLTSFILGVVVDQSLQSPAFTKHEKRLLFRRQSDYRLPGSNPGEVADLIAVGLIRFLISTPYPRRVIGMFDLPRVNETSIWERKHRSLYRELLLRQLKIHGIPVNAYLDNPSLYLDLGAFDAPKDTQT